MKNSFSKDVLITMLAILAVGLLLPFFRWCAAALLRLWTDQSLEIWDLDVSLLLGVATSAFAAAWIVLRFVSRPRVWPGLVMIASLAFVLTFVVGRLRIYSMGVVV